MSAFKIIAEVGGGRDDTPEKVVKPFVRDGSDNKLFTEIQVNDLASITDSSTRWKLDGDGIVWKACSSVETLFIVVKNLETGDEEELQGIQQFKGLGKKISVDSWLGVQNVKREAKELPLYTPDDFEVTQHSRLNYKTEDIAFEQVQVIIRTKLKALRQQHNIDNIDFCIGEGECFRHKLDLVKTYKGDRSPLRPIILKRARKWILEELKGELAPAGFENDDYVEWFGMRGYRDYKKSGVFSFGVILEDKDGFSNPKLIVHFGVHSGKDNPKKGQWKYPQPWLIHDTSVSVGEMDLVVTSKKELKASGLKWVIAQALLIGDSADCYSALKHLPPHHKKGINYADVGAYKDFVDLKTPQEVLQKVVDLYADFLPYGVQYSTHSGKELDVDTMTYMNTYFLVAYMTRSDKDTTDFYKLCKAFKVDTSKIVSNNLLTPPVRVFITNDTTEAKVLTLQSTIASLITDELTAFKALKKADLCDRMDSLKEKLSAMNDSFEEFYHMKQNVKGLPTEDSAFTNDNLFTEEK